MFAEHFFLAFAVVLVVGYAAYAWNNGVVAMLWGIIGAFVGIAGGMVLYRFVIGGLPLSFGARLAVAFIAGLVIYLIARVVVKSLTMSLFEPDGPLHFLADGFGGMVVSLVPSVLTLLVLAVGLRIGGTLTDLRRYELLVTPTRFFTVKEYPRRPLVAQWRDGLESLPGALETLELIDPVGRVAKRNLVGVLITSKMPPLQRYLANNPESKPVFESPLVISLSANEEVVKLNQNGDRLGLLNHPAVKAAVQDPELRRRLTDLELHRLVDGFLLSPEWQRLVESYRRDPGAQKKIEPKGADR